MNKVMNGMNDMSGRCVDMWSFVSVSWKFRVVIVECQKVKDLEKLIKICLYHTLSVR